MKRLILILFVLLQLSAVAQLKKANRLFTAYRYSEAIPYFEKEVNNKNKKTHYEAVVKLAKCYQKVSKYQQAIAQYRIAITNPQSQPENLYQLAVLLRTVGKYNEAENYFAQYLQQNPNSVKAQTYHQFCKDIVLWENLAPSAEIKNAVNINSSYSDFSPLFYQGNIWFVSDRDIDYMNNDKYQWTHFGYLDIYTAKSAIKGNYWNGFAAPEIKKGGYNTYYHDGPVSFSKNGKKVFITRTTKQWIKRDKDNYQTHCLQLFYGDVKPNEKVKWIAFPYNNTAYSTGHATLSPNGNSVIFSSDKPDGKGGSDLYLSQWQNNEWSKPVSLGENINTFGNEVFPFWLNENTLYFASDGHLGYGGLDLFVVKKENGKWGKATNLKQPINSSYDDFSIAINATTNNGAFASNRPRGKGSDDIYLFKNIEYQVETKPEAKTEPHLTIDGYVKDFENKSPVNNATVFLLNTNSQMVQILKTDSNGYFSTSVDYNKLYMVKAMQKNYFADFLTFRTNVAKTENKMAIPRNLLLRKYAVNKEFKIENIYYDLNESAIREDAQPALDRLVKLLKAYPVDVEIGSHTDSRATKSYNRNLSQKRAEAAVRYLILQGIAPYRISAKGYGESQLVNQCVDGVNCTEAQHQANRRTTFKIVRINNTKNSYNIDLSKFKAGDMVPLQLFPANFFSNVFLSEEIK